MVGWTHPTQSRSFWRRSLQPTTIDDKTMFQKSGQTQSADTQMGLLISKYWRDGFDNVFRPHTLVLNYADC